MAKKIMQDQEELVDVPHASKDVPWKRSGHPMFEGSESNYKWQHDVCNRGPDSHRVLTDEQLIDIGARWHGEIPIGYLRERCVVQMWDFENNHPTNTKIIHSLLQSMMGKEVLSQRDLYLCELGAITALQWTQTNVGRAFMESVLKLAQREQKRFSAKVKEHQKLLVAVGELYDQDGKIMGGKCVTKRKAKASGGAGATVGSPGTFADPIQA